jgi:predicted oxidoreductase (fatty acid repression mutant protein)
VMPSPPGVFLYLGFSRIDSEVLKKGRMKLNDEVPLTEEEEENEVKNTIQQTVSHFTSNANKSDCRIVLESRQGENYILKATLDEFDEYRMKKNMSDFMKWKEKEECFAALASISTKVNAKDRDMMSHIILSMFKVAAAEGNVPEYTPSSAHRTTQLLLNILLILSFQIYSMHRQPLL